MELPNVFRHWFSRELTETQAWALIKYFGQTTPENAVGLLDNPAVTTEMVKYLFRTGNPEIVAALYNRKLITFDDIIAEGDDFLAESLARTQYSFDKFVKAFTHGGDRTRKALFTWAPNLTNSQVVKVAPMVFPWVETQVQKDQVDASYLYGFFAQAENFAKLYTEIHPSVENRICYFVICPPTVRQQKDVQDLILSLDEETRTKIIGNGVFEGFIKRALLNFERFPSHYRRATAGTLLQILDTFPVEKMLGVYYQAHYDSVKTKTVEVEVELTERPFDPTLHYFLRLFPNDVEELFISGEFDEEVFTSILSQTSENVHAYVLKVFSNMWALPAPVSERIVEVMFQKCPEVLTGDFVQQLWSAYPNPKFALLMPWNTFSNFSDTTQSNTGAYDAVVTVLEETFGDQEHLWETFLHLAQHGKDSTQKLINKTLLVHG